MHPSSPNTRRFGKKTNEKKAQQGYPVKQYEKTGMKHVKSSCIYGTESRKFHPKTRYPIPVPVYPPRMPSQNSNETKTDAVWPGWEASNHINDTMRPHSS